MTGKPTFGPSGSPRLVNGPCFMCLSSDYPFPFISMSRNGRVLSANVRHASDACVIYDSQK